MKKRWMCYLLICAMILQYEPMEVQAAGTKVEVTNVSGSSLTIAQGSSFRLKTNTNIKYLSFSSSKKKIATVNSNGIIHAIKKGNAVITITNKKTDTKKKLKLSVKSPSGYKITKVTGTYQDSVNVKITAKSGYKVYYSTNGKLVKKQVIKSAKSKEFTFDKTTTLTIFVFKNKEKITSDAKQKKQAFYTYTIEDKSSDTDNKNEEQETNTTDSSTEANSTDSNTEETPTEKTTEESNVEESPTEKPTEGESTGESETKDPTEGESAGEAETEDPIPETPTPEEPLPEVPEGVTQATFSKEQIEIIMGEKPSEKIVYNDVEGTEILSISKNNKITISKGGTYRIASATDAEVTGCIEVDTQEDVNIILAGVNMTSDNVEGVFTVKKKVNSITVTLEDETVNTFKDLADIETKTETDEETGETTTTTVYPDGAFVSKQAPTVIQGAGELVVSSKLGNGVKSTGDLTINNAAITVLSAGNNGISAKRALTVTGAVLEVTSDGDGIKTTTPDDETDTLLGNMLIENSTITINSNEDGIQAYRNAGINNCIMNITASKNSNKLTTVEGETKDSFKGIKANGILSISEGNYIIKADSDKGLKADTEVSINGGTFSITSSDDAIHSDTKVTVDGESTNITISTDDDGIHADNELTINNGNIKVMKSYEGLEAMNINIKGGDVKVVASDDGINVAGGADSSGTMSGDRFGPGGGFGGAGGETVIDGALTISGGKVSVAANGDGLDSNGNMYITGGEVYVSGPESGGNGIFDCNGEFKISGGVLVGAGTSSMAVTPSADSEQSFVSITLSGSRNAGTEIVLKDTSGNTIVSFTPEMKYQLVVVSTSAITKGETYQLYIDGLLAGSAVAGSSSGGNNRP